jgi:hypothetical protein
MSTRTALSHPAASVEGKVAAALLLGVGAFQVCLAAGAPWGRASYGGAHAGVLPTTLRRSSAVSSGVYVALAAAAGTSLVGAVARRRVLAVTAPVMVVGAVMNLVSPSVVERSIWTPVTAVLAATLWRASRRAELAA